MHLVSDQEWVLATQFGQSPMTGFAKARAAWVEDHAVAEHTVSSFITYSEGRLASAVIVLLENTMIGLAVSLNRKKLTVAGADDLAVLTSQCISICTLETVDGIFVG
jgi:hypothetical protein